MRAPPNDRTPRGRTGSPPDESRGPVGRRAFVGSLGGLLGLAAFGCERARPVHVASVPVARPLPVSAPPVPVVAAALDPVVVAPVDPGFFGEDDSAVRASLRDAPVKTIRKGGGGRSLGFKITLEDGTMGYFKPDQAIDYTHYWAEIGAYYLDRTLGFGRVPPTVGRTFDFGHLSAFAQTDPRLAELRPRRGGMIRGAFIAWVHEGPAPLTLGRGWERWVRVEGALDRTPYVPAVMQANGVVPAERRDAPEVPPDARRPAELSDMLVFDYLIQNADRWGSENTNVRTRGPDGPLMFFDNGAGFWPTEQRLPIMERRLSSVQRFRRRTLDALRAFDRRALVARLSTDPLAPVLDERMLAGLEMRVGVVVSHADRMLERFGDRALLVG